MIKSNGRLSTIATDLRSQTWRLLRARPSARTRWALKAIVALLVLLTVGRHIQQNWRRIHEQTRSLRVEPGWILLGVLAYLAGLCACGVFFGKILAASPTPVRMFTAVRAYLISHLGKYVPGKALVVVMRVGLVAPYGARRSTAAFATLYETLVMMASGSLVAALGFIVVPLELWPILVGLVLAFAFLVVVDPKVFPRVSAAMSGTLLGVGADALPTFSRRLLIEGLACTAIAWTFLGLSQVAVVRALSPGFAAIGLGFPSLLVLMTASVALATVVGFVVAVLPGGLGVREGVLMATLGPALGPEMAILSALALRLTWVVAEILIASVLSLAKPKEPTGARA